MILRADAARLPFADGSFDLVIGSPPYITARKYYEAGADLGIARDCRAWVAWMLVVTTEALRVSQGLVLWVVAGVTRDRCYQPGPEGLLWEWWAQGGDCHCLRPVVWHRVGIPGSGGDEWFRADTESVLAFNRPGPLPWAENTANGVAPRWAPGGAMSHRLGDGTRRNQWGGGSKSSSSRRANGDRQPVGRPSHRVKTKWMLEPDGTLRSQSYDPPVIANPGNLLHTSVGGGQMGSSLAHENEAPFPEAVPAWFIASHCPPKGRVLDPFVGSGTTVAAALALGRDAVGCDLRQSQCALARRRIATVTLGFAFGGEADHA